MTNIYSCKYINCSFEHSDINVLLNHVYMLHSLDHTFKICSCHPRCSREYSSFKSFNKHVKKNIKRNSSIHVE